MITTTQSKMALPAAGEMKAAVQGQRAQRKNLPMNVDRCLEILLRQGLVQTTKVLTTYRTIL